MENTIGYQPDFIGPHLKVDLPSFNPSQREDVASADSTEGELKYLHYSAFLSKKRKFPYYTASNVNGELFRQVKRDDLFPGGRDQWTVDERLENAQWGQVLYSARKSDFDRGHLTKREDTQWGETFDVAKEAAKDTFYFSNCTPQLSELNQKKWLKLETYILHKEAVNYKLLINVITGPVLANDDPVFVTPVKGQEVQLPVLFWKVIYYTNDGVKLNKVGFLMGQEKLMLERGIGIPVRREAIFKKLVEKEHFMDFEDAETYQVNLQTIEELTGHTFAPAHEPYTDLRPVKLIVRDVQVTQKMLEEAKGPVLDVEYEGLVL